MAERYNFLIGGMTCSACSARLERVLANADGIASAAVNLPLERATVEVADGHGPAAVAAVITRAGFDAGTETRRFTVKGVRSETQAASARTALAGVPGVVAVDIDADARQADVTMYSLAVADDALGAAAAEAGFGLAAVGSAADAAAEREQRKLARERWALAIALLLTSPFLMHMAAHYLQMVAHYLGAVDVTIGFALPFYVEAALATPLQFVFGVRFYRGAFNALRGGGANMDVLVALGTTAAYSFSWYQIIAEGTGAANYFEASGIIITLVMLGKYMESHAKRGAAQAIQALLALRPDTALVRLASGGIVERPVHEVQVGDILVCRPGQQVAADGVVVKGDAEIDEALVTGESAPVPKRPGDPVTTGTINIDGLIDIEIHATGAESTLAKMIRLIENAQASKPAVQRLVDRVSSVFVPTVVAISVIALIGQLLAGADAETAIVNAVSVLVIACPCALGLATPTAIMTGSGAAARAGILIKDVSSLEQAHSLSHVVFDKTGTLTEGHPELREIDTLAGIEEDESLAIMASLQQGSEHPIAEALRQAAQTRGLALRPIENFTSSVAQGVEADIDGVHYLAGNANLFLTRGLDPPPRDLHFGGTEVWLGASVRGGDALLAWFQIVDALRPQAKAAVRALKTLGIKPLLISGDAEEVTARIGKEVDIDDVYGKAQPEDKARIVEELMRGGARVAMTGDGINDAPALAEATVGIAMGSGTDVAMETAAITLMRSDPRLVAGAVDISRRTFRKIKQNLFWAFIYNIVGLPLAALGFLSPPFAAFAMALSSLSVVGNSLILRTWKPSLED